MDDWMQQFGDDEVRIDFADVEHDMDGYPTVSEFTFTDLTGTLACQDLEDYAMSQMEGEWTVQTTYWMPAGKKAASAFVVVVTVPQPEGALV